MIQPTPNAALRLTMRAIFATLALLLATSALAQWGTVDYMAQMDALLAEQDARIAHMQAQIEAQQQEAMMAFVRYYREETGDYQTPDALAFEYGVNLYCQRNAAECQQAHAANSAAAASAHEARMRDIQSWGAVSAGIAASNASILDSSHQGFLDRSALQDQGQANYVQGAIQGESTFSAPSFGAGWSLPVMPDPNTQYWTPDGQPLTFDFQSGVWYVGTSWGWTPLEAQR